MTTRFLSLAHHTATGVFLSDTTLRFVILKQQGDSVPPEQYADLALPVGCFDNGVLKEKGQFVSFLKKIKKDYNIETVNIALASTQMRTFNVSAKGTGTAQIKVAIEKVFDKPLKDIAYDHNVVSGNSANTVFHVTALPKAISQDIVSAFKSAGIIVLSIESIAHAIARDVLPAHTRQSVVIIDIGVTSTPLIFIAHGKVAEMVTLPFGNTTFITTLLSKLQGTEEEMEQLKVRDGLIAEDSRQVFDALVDDCMKLVKEINEAYIQWRTQHASLPAIDGVFLTGAGSTLRGLDEYISNGLRLPVSTVNVWANCLAFEEHIPSLSQESAVRYAAAIGTALVGGDTINLIPHDHKKSLQRKHAARVSVKIFISFVLGVVVGFGVAKLVTIPAVHTPVMTVLHKIRAQW